MSNSRAVELVDRKRGLQRALTHPETIVTMERLLPDYLSVERMQSLAIMAAVQEPKLLACSPKSVVRAVLAACICGLEINGPLGHAWIVPFGREAVLVPGYKGLLYLAREGGAIRRGIARLVYEQEPYAVEYGTLDRIEHTPVAGVTRSPETVVAAYFVWWPPNSPDPDFEWMWRDELEGVRARSRSGDRGPWATDTEAMYRKTVVRRGLKYAPASATRLQRLGAALELDTRAETGSRDVLVPGLDTRPDEDYESDPLSWVGDDPGEAAADADLPTPAELRTTERTGVGQRQLANKLARGVQED